MYIAGDDVVFRKEVLRKSVRFRAHHVGIEEEGCETGDKSKDADMTFVSLSTIQLATVLLKLLTSSCDAIWAFKRSRKYLRWPSC